MIRVVHSAFQLRRLNRLTSAFQPAPREGTPSEIESSPTSISRIWETLVDRANLSEESRRRYEVSNVLVWSFTLVTFLFVTKAIFLVVPMVVSIVSCLRIRTRISARNREFDRDYPTFLTTLSSTVRTGMDPRAAFAEAAKVFPLESSIRVEIMRMIDAWSSGEADETAVAKFASGIRHSDVELLRSATRLALSHGTSFSECLHRLARVTRQRQSFRRKVRAALAMQRLSALGIGISAFTIAGLQLVTNRPGLNATMEAPAGRVFLVLGLLLIVAGVGWMMRIGLRAD